MERNVGERPQSLVLCNLVGSLYHLADGKEIEVLPTQRVRVGPTRFRVPDVIALRLPQDDELIVTSPPYICIEILSREDTVEDMLEKIDDYLRFGVQNAWIISPRHRKAYVATATGTTEATSGKLETHDPAIGVPLSAVFE